MSHRYRSGGTVLTGLKKCPFCASTTLNGQADVYGSWVRCMDCLAAGPIGTRREETEKMWATRRSKKKPYFHFWKDKKPSNKTK